MKSTLFLATLVASLSLLQGCYALTGCPGSPQCDPNYVADADTGDSNSSPETNVGNDSTKVAETKDPLAACPPEYKARINGVNKWACNDIGIECKLVLVTLNAGKYCAVQCPKEFTVKVPDQAKLVSDIELAYQVPNFEPHSCVMVTN